MKVGVLGLGSIAEPMVRSLVRRFDLIQIMVSPRSPSIAQQLSSEFKQVSVAKNNQEVVDRSDIVLLCLLQKVARRELPQLQFRAAQKLLSVMVDYSVADLKADCSPASDISMTVPLPFIATGRCPLPVYPHADVVKLLFGDENIILPLPDENALTPFLVSTAIMATLMQQLNQVSHWLDSCCQDSVVAEKYILNLTAGYLNALSADGHNRFDQALDDLSTEGGLNAQLLNDMTDAGHYQQLRKSLDQLNQRLGYVPEPD